ncbi:hypothetical protein ACFL4W_01235 [Planctomycetota bacterium]
MEILYCSNCKSRVSSVDIEQGKGLKADNKAYCQDCVRVLDLKPEPAPHRPGSALRVRKASDAKRPVSPTRRPISEGRIRAVGPDQLPAKPESNMTAIIAILAIVVLGLVGLLLFLLTRESPPRPAPRPPQPPAIADAPLDKPLPDNPVVPDKPVPPPVEPDKPPVVITGKGIPAFPGDTFPESWKSFMGPDWKKTWEAGRTSWEFKDNLLTAFLDPEKGTGMLRSFPEWGDFEIGISFATDMPCLLDFKFRDEGKNYGNYTVQRTRPGTWHTLTWRVKGDKIEKAEFDGQDVTRTFNTGKMKRNGRLALAIRPDRYEPCTISIGAIRINELPRELPAGTEELVKNSSFRKSGGEVFADWDFWGKWENGVYTLHRAAGRDDDACAELRVQTKGRGGIYQSLKARTGEKVRATFWYRTEKADQGRVFFNFEGSGDYAWKGKDLVGGTHDWQKATLEATIPFGKDGRPMPNFSIYIYNASSGALFVDDVSVCTVGGAAVADGPPGEAGGIDLLKGASLAEAGWIFHSGDGLYVNKLKLENNILQCAPNPKPGRVDKIMPLGDGTFSFEFEHGCDHWVFGLSHGSPANDLRVQFDRNSAGGRHTCQIIIKGTETIVFIDGAPATIQDGISILTKLSHPLSKPTRIMISGTERDAFELWNFRWQPAGAKTVPEGWTDLLPTDNLAASGWSYGHDNDSYKENFSIENGVLIKPIRTAHCKVDRKVDFNRGELSFDYEQEGDYWQMNIMSQGNFGLVFSVGARGKHSIRILLMENSATVFWDGKPLEPGNGRIRISSKLEKPIRRPSTIRFYVSDKTGIRISNFRYRQSE